MDKKELLEQIGNELSGEELKHLLDMVRTRKLEGERKMLENITDRLDISELSRLLRKKEEVVAVQIWQKDDLRSLLEQENCNTSEDAVDWLACEVRGVLEDTTYGIEAICDTIDDAGEKLWM